MTPEGQEQRLWKVGALAARAGLTVRALHHYDALGLCRPSQRTAAGHRLYTADDVTRLYRVALLRRLGLRLDEIATALDEPRWQLTEALSRHLEDTTERLAVTSRLRNRLAAMCDQIDTDTSPSTDELFTTLEEMTMLDTPIRSTTALLVYDDVAAAQDYLVRVFGLTAGSRDTDPSGRVRHAEVRAGDHVVWLHPSGQDYQSPRSLGATTGMTVIVVDDLNEHNARAVAGGAHIIEERPSRTTACASTAPATSRATCGSSTNRSRSRPARQRALAAQDGSASAGPGRPPTSTGG